MRRALVVDDTKNIRNMLTTCLELRGYYVSSTGNGKEALDIIEKETFDIAFIDIKMPEISGTEVLRRTRALGLDFPIVIMTAFATVKNAIECTKLGAVTYLQKPFSIDKINDVLKIIENDKHQDNIQGRLEYCTQLIKSSDYDEAFKCLKKLLSIDPSCGEIYYLIGVIYKEKGNNIEADKFFNTASQFGHSTE